MKSREVNNEKQAVQQTTVKSPLNHSALFHATKSAMLGIQPEEATHTHQHQLYSRPTKATG